MRGVRPALLALVLGWATAIKAAQPVEVVIDHHAFTPETLSVRKGETVRWVNRDTVPHAVSVGEVSSPVLAPGESFEWTFLQSALLSYGCPLHSRMEARLKVE